MLKERFAVPRTIMSSLPKFGSLTVDSGSDRTRLRTMRTEDNYVTEDASDF